jgi:hypothetical protein
LLLALAVVGVIVIGGNGAGKATGTPMIVTRVITKVVPSESGGLIDAPPSLLLTPTAADRLTGHARFEWEWNDAALAEDQAFELHVWSQQEDGAGTGARGAIARTRETATVVDLDRVPTIEEHGSGAYYWTVVVVDTGTQRVVGQLLQTRTFWYSGS